MCKLANYKLVRAQADKLVHHINRSTDLNYIEANNKHDKIITQEAIYAYLPLCYDVISKISCRKTIDVFNDFIQSLEQDLNNYSFVDIILEYKSLYDKYIDLLSNIDSGYHIFDHKCSLKSIVWWEDKGLFKIPLFDREAYELLTELVAQVLLFPSKLEYEGEKDRLEAEAIEKWYKAEDRNKQQDDIESHDSFYDYLYDLLSIIVEYWFRSSRFQVDLDLCCNGSGAVNITADYGAQRDAAANKWTNFLVPMKLQHVISNILVDRTLEEINPLYLLTEDELVAFFITVAKNCTARRGISLEAPAFQFIQQGIRKSAYSYIRHSRDKYMNAIGNFVFLEDNTFNKSLAQVGSITDEYATTDLSSASDSVRVSSVRKMFKRVPHVCKWLLATRSNKIQVKNKKIEVSKFAGMGSGNCFWVETTVFAALAFLGSMYDRSSLLNRRVTPDRLRKDLSKKRCPQFLVYGDDIITHRLATDTVVWLLEILGFKVNTDKSFFSGHFKESCGGNYFMGHDITPIKWNVSFGSEKIVGQEAFSALISYANMGYRRKYPIFREHCIKRLLTSGNLPEFSGDIDDDSKIYSPTPTNYHLLSSKYSKKKREICIYGDGYRREIGWPRDVMFKFRKLLCRRTKYPCTVVKVIKPTDFDVNDIHEDIMNSQYYQWMVNGNTKSAFRPGEGSKRMTVEELTELVRYLNSTTNGGSTDPFDIKCDRPYRGLKRIYHLTKPLQPENWIGKVQSKLGYGYFEIT